MCGYVFSGGGGGWSCGAVCGWIYFLSPFVLFTMKRWKDVFLRLINSAICCLSMYFDWQSGTNWLSFQSDEKKLLKYKRWPKLRGRSFAFCDRWTLTRSVSCGGGASKSCLRHGPGSNQGQAVQLSDQTNAFPCQMTCISCFACLSLSLYLLIRKFRLQFLNILIFVLTICIRMLLLMHNDADVWVVTSTEEWRQLKNDMDCCLVSRWQQPASPPCIGAPINYPEGHLVLTTQDLDLNWVINRVTRSF